MRLSWAEKKRRPQRNMGEFSADNFPRETKYLGLPNDLTGKKVLEPFSGGIMPSEKRFVEEHGGQYFSLEKKRRLYMPPGTHVHGDAWRLPFADHSFDYVIMNNPTIFQRAEPPETLEVRADAIPMLAECIRVLSESPGSKVAVSNGLSQKSIGFVTQSLTELMPDFSEKFEVQSEVWGPRYRKGVRLKSPPTHSMQIIRK